MSNYLAVATVSSVLRSLLQELVPSAVPGAGVTVRRPEKMGGDGGQPRPTVNLFLYQVTPNTAWRNADLPTRSPNGQVRQRPQVALDLSYLLTFYGNEASMEPQRLLGKVVSSLHAQPLLSPERIRQAIQTARQNRDPDDDYLIGSDLAEQLERIRLAPISLNFEELSKLWSIFFQVPYALSIAYQASVVLIESEQLIQPATPVQERRIELEPRDE